MTSHTAKYKEITEILRNEIRDGRYSNSHAFPSVTRLKRRFAVSHLTAVKVLDILKKEGLVASRQGAGSFVRRSRTFGLIIPGVSYGEFFPPIVSEVSRLCQKEGVGLLFGDAFSENPLQRAEQTRKLAHDFVVKGVSGVLFHPLDFFPDALRTNHEITRIFDTKGIPVILIDSDIVLSPERSGFDLVGVNNYEAGDRLVRHLLAQGARRVHFLCYKGCVATSGQGRFRGAASALRAAGLLREKNTLEVPFPHPLDVATLRTYMRRHRPDAFICASDTGAAYLMSALVQIGKRVPEDVLVAGFDDVQHAKIVTPQLTTIHQPCTDIAAQAFCALLERLKNPRRPAGWRGGVFSAGSSANTSATSSRR